jgi:four helix bundle protein
VDIADEAEGGVIGDYKDLAAWQVAMSVCEDVYALTQKLPDCERYGLISQMQRAAVSIPANIAEGYGRGSRADYCRFVRVARGSAAELETELLLAQRLGLLEPADVMNVLRHLARARRLIHGLVRSLED